MQATECTFCSNEVSMLQTNVLDGAFECACRFDLDHPGFALIDLGARISPRDLRATMVDLKRALSRRFAARTGRELHYISMGRFDQQVTTKFHLDGAPVESILMLGYEPTAVRSRIYLADYSKCAFDLGISPNDFLTKYNPMFTRGAELLSRYISEIAEFRSDHFQLLIINNSSASVGAASPQTLGVMHKAEIINSDLSQCRIVNSTMIGAFNSDAVEQFTVQMQEHFIASDVVSPRLS